VFLGKWREIAFSGRRMGFRTAEAEANLSNIFQHAAGNVFLMMLMGRKGESSSGS